MYEFIYCFILDGRIDYSSETANSLTRWAEDEKNRQRITDFVEYALPGDFISLTNGALIFRSAPTPLKPTPPAPRSLFDVLDDSGLLED